MYKFLPMIILLVDDDPRDKEFFKEVIHAVDENIVCIKTINNEGH
jgi:hypothetical protein